MRRILLLISVLGLGAESSGPARAADCPADSVNSAEITAAAFDTVWLSHHVSLVDTSYAAYDLVAGHIEGRIYSPEGSGEVWIRTWDDYTLDLPGAGPTPAAITLELFAHVEGSPVLGAYAGATHFWVTGPGVNWDEIAALITAWDRVIEIPISVSPNTPFRLRYSILLQTGLNGLEAPEYATLRFRFKDLPPGSGLVSCQGFLAGGPVPARTTTWGNLKARYR